MAKTKSKLKIFSVLAGLILLFAGLTELVSGYGYTAISMIVGYMYYGMSVSSILSLVTNLLGPTFFALLMIVTAIALMVKRDGAFVFITMGLLTYKTLAALMTPVINIIFRTVGIYGGEDAMANTSVVFNTISSIVYFIGAIAVAVVCFLAATTFLKKKRFVVMLILFVLFLIGALVSTGWQALVIVSNFRSYMIVLEHFTGLETLRLAFTYFIRPIFIATINDTLCLAALFATLGMLPGKKKAQVEVTEAAAEETAEEVVRETIVE